MMQYANVVMTRTGATAVVEFTRSCLSDGEAINKVSHQIADCITRQHPYQVVFDFSRVTFFSSQVLGLLLEAHARLRENHGRVLVRAVSPQCRRIFKITKLERIFQFVPNRPSSADSPVS